MRAEDSSASIGVEKGVAAVGTVSSFAALLSAAACCVLPLAFAAIGLGTGALAILVPFHWPLTIGAALAIAAGWALYARRRRQYGAKDDCTAAPPSRATFIILCVATAFVALSAIWPSYLEQPLMRLFGSA